MSEAIGEQTRRCYVSCRVHDLQRRICLARVELGLSMEGEPVIEGQACKYPDVPRYKPSREQN